MSSRWRSSLERLSLGAVILIACLCFSFTGMGSSFAEPAPTEDIDVILQGQWAHMKSHVTEHGYPPLIFTDPVDPSVAIPYAFSDQEDIDLDGLTNYGPPGKVTDFEALVVSESASYALLRALWMDDKTTFDRVWKWTKLNLQHKSIAKVFDWKARDTKPWVDPVSLGLVRDYLFAWRWLPSVHGTPTDGIIAAKERDRRSGWKRDGIKAAKGWVRRPGWNLVWVDGWGFASDADQDIALALILADAAWGSGTGIFDYALQAGLILGDLWKQGTYVVNGKRYLNGGTGAWNNIEPGYLSPFSYRIFEEFDPDHSWKDLVATSYEVFNKAARMQLADSFVDGVSVQNGGSGALSRLLPDWVAILPDGSLANCTMRNEPELGTDAFRAYWRIAVDYEWNQSVDALSILESGTFYGPHDFIESKLDNDWSKTDYNESGKIPRIMAHDGRYLLNEATGAGIEITDTGSRADAGSYAVWLSYFGATHDSVMTEKLLDPLIRYDADPCTAQNGAACAVRDVQGYTHGTDGWLVKDNDGIYWKVHDRSDWRTDTDYYLNTWAWLGLALYKGGYIVNTYNTPHSEPSPIESLGLMSSLGAYVTEINDVAMVVEVRGADKNADRVDFTYVSISSSDETLLPESCGPITVKCAETEPNSGIYRGSFTVAAFSNDARDEIGGQTGSRLSFTAGSQMLGATIAEITYGNKTLVDACDHTRKDANELGGYWYEALDDGEGHTSTGIMSFPKGGISGNCAKFEYRLQRNPLKSSDTVFSIMGTRMTKDSAGTINLNDFDGISFYVRGSGKQMSVVLRSTNINDYDYYQYTISTTPGEWRQYVLRFENFSQEPWGAQVLLGDCLAKVTDLHFKASSKVDGEEGWFEVDNIVLLGTRNKYNDTRCVLQGMAYSGHSLENYTWEKAGDAMRGIPDPIVANTTESMEGNGATKISFPIVRRSPKEFWWLGILAPTGWGAPAVTDWSGWTGVSFQIKLPDAFDPCKANPRIRLEVRNKNAIEGGRTAWYKASLTAGGFRIYIPKTEFYKDPENPGLGAWNGDWTSLASFRIHYGSADGRTVPNAVIVDDIRLYKPK